MRSKVLASQRKIFGYSIDCNSRLLMLGIIRITIRDTFFVAKWYRESSSGTTSSLRVRTIFVV